MFKRAKRILEAFRDAGANEEMRFRQLLRAGKWILPKYRFTWPQLAWWLDNGFNGYLKRFNELEGANTHRRWTVYQLTRLVVEVPGDTVECGVFEGAGSYLICRSVIDTNHSRTHFMFDTFEGLSAPVAMDGTYWKEGHLSCSLEKAKANLADLDKISWKKGMIPTRFEEVQDRAFAFVHIDVDLYEPTRDSIRFFYPRMNQGGIIVCDDYGFTTCPGATLAIDEFLAEKPEKMIGLPSGGGFLIKGCRTGNPIAL